MQHTLANAEPRDRRDTVQPSAPRNWEREMGHDWVTRAMVAFCIVLLMYLVWLSWPH